MSRSTTASVTEAVQLTLRHCRWPAREHKTRVSSGPCHSPRRRGCRPVAETREPSGHLESMSRRGTQPSHETRQTCAGCTACNGVVVPRHPKASHPVPCPWPCSIFQAVATSNRVSIPVAECRPEAPDAQHSHLDAPRSDEVCLLFGLWPIEGRSQRSLDGLSALHHHPVGLRFVPVQCIRREGGGRRVRTANPLVMFKVMMITAREALDARWPREGCRRRKARDVRRAATQDGSKLMDSQPRRGRRTPPTTCRGCGKVMQCGLQGHGEGGRKGEVMLSPAQLRPGNSSLSTYKYERCVSQGMCVVYGTGTCAMPPPRPPAAACAHAHVLVGGQPCRAGGRRIKRCDWWCGCVAPKA